MASGRLSLLHWRWKSRPQAGRPQIETDLRALIRRMSIENPVELNSQPATATLSFAEPLDNERKRVR